MSAKPVVVISSLVADGSVGARAAVFALERLGHRVVSVPTVQLAWHPGRGKSTRIDTPPGVFADLLDDLLAAPVMAEAGAVLTGYFAHPMQAMAAAEFVEKAKAAHPGLIHLCDPVLGDAGRLYVHAETAGAIRDWLLPRADVATPNLFELGWTTGKPVESLADQLAAARALGPKLVAVTSVPAMMRGRIGTLMVTPERAFMAEHVELGRAPNGTGDLFAALFLSRLLDGKAPERAMERAVAGVFEMVAAAERRGAAELPLAADQDRFVHPMANVALRSVGSPAAPTKPPRPAEA